MRRARWGAGVVLTAVLALVAVPGSAGSRSPGGDPAIAPELFQPVSLDAQGVPQAATSDDPAFASASALEGGSVFREPAAGQAAVAVRAQVGQPVPRAGSIDLNPWRFDGNVSWYGPGFYGSGTACGQHYTISIIGVAHRTLPCGTRITFRNPANGRTITAAVIDRGPYVTGRQWDLSAGLCLALGHCYTGSLYWKFAY